MDIVCNEVFLAYGKYKPYEIYQLLHDGVQ